MDIIEFFIPGKPMSKGSTKSFYVKGRIVSTSTNKALNSWNALARLIASEQAPPEPWGSSVRLELRFTFQEPKSTPKKSRGKLAMMKRPDIDKCCRAVLDSLTGIFYRDDSQVEYMSAAKHYGQKPGVLVQIWQTNGLTDAFSASPGVPGGASEAGGRELG